MRESDWSSDVCSSDLLKNFPAPNTAGDASGLNNFVAGNTFESADVRKMFQPLVRVDVNWTPKHKSFLRYNQTRFDNNFLNYTDTTDPKVTGQIFSRDSRSAVLDNVFIVSPTLVLNVRFGFTWYNDHRKYHSDGWDITKGFGFPAILTSQLNPACFTYPNFQIDSYLALGSAAGTNNPAYSTNLPVALNWMRGNHSVKFGVDFRQKFMTQYSPGNVSPQLLYGTTASRPVYTNGPYNTSSYAPTGQGLASFLLGIPTGGGVDINDSKAEESKFFGFYAQDDWRVARRLTLNVGLRWEYETALTERFNRSTRQFDYTTPSPISAQAQAQYAASPIPQIAPGDFKTLGGLTFAGVGGNPRGVYPSYTGAWMPRFGFAYQVRPNLAVRGGYGVYFDMLGSPVSTAALSGFNRRTTVAPATTTASPTWRRRRIPCPLA
jgi:outer membrane receptor protein involved in Fe transport